MISLLMISFDYKKGKTEQPKLLDSVASNIWLIWRQRQRTTRCGFASSKKTRFAAFFLELRRATTPWR